MEKINTKELFEKYRHSMDNEKRCVLSGWNQTSSVEEYMEEEGYGQGVVLFLMNISKITDGEFIKYHSKNNIHYEDSFDTTYDEVIFKRNDGKLFKCDICEEYGEYSEEMKEVKEKVKTINCYE